MNRYTGLTHFLASRISETFVPPDNAAAIPCNIAAECFGSLMRKALTAADGQPRAAPS
jgi:hypothetical protein